MISRVPGRGYQLRGVFRRNLGPAHFKDFGAVNVRTLKVECISFRSLCKKERVLSVECLHSVPVLVVNGRTESKIQKFTKKSIAKKIEQSPGTTKSGNS